MAMPDAAPENSAAAEDPSSTASVAATDNGKSRTSTLRSVGTGCSMAHSPSTTSRLNRLEPTTLLSAISLEPCTAAAVLTASSGALVPMATMVSPITSDGTWNRRASPDAPPTNRSAPFTSAAKPATSIRM